MRLPIQIPMKATPARLLFPCEALPLAVTLPPFEIRYAGGEGPLPARRRFPSLRQPAGSPGPYVLRLYIAGSTRRSTQAISSVHALCENHLKGRYDLKVIDIYQQPEDAGSERIIATPTIIKTGPGPVRRVVGDLSDPRRILDGLDLRPDHISPEALS